MKQKPIVLFHVVWMGLILIGGCLPRIIDQTDREVYQLIEERQKAAIGATSNVYIGKERSDIAAHDRMYRFNPRPLDAGIPETFRKKRKPSAVESESSPPSSAEDQTSESESVDPLAAKTNSIFSEDQWDRVTVFGLSNALAYAVRHARSLLDAKEDLYLATLDLTLERHLWTPLFIASMQADFDFSDPGGLRDEDKAFTAVADLAVSQRLQHGGVITARIVSELVRDLSEHVVEGENGDLILQADIPLFRGAGKVAYESRYIAERELIYAVRSYERFRRSFLVRVASDYFNLQQLKAAINNTFQAYQSRQSDWEKADFINRMGRSRTIFEAPRAKSSLRSAESTLVSVKERYASSLDRFKILIGMPVEQWLDVLDQNTDKDARAVDDLLPNVIETDAVNAALKYRLDLLNFTDGVDDTRRGVIIAKNRLLPDLDFTGRFIIESNPDHANSTRFNLERGSWGAGFHFRIDDRKRERNDYRRSLLNLRRAARNHELFVDDVRADVRRAMRRIIQQENLRSILAMNVKENEFRAAAARAQFDLGKSTNQDVVDAENDLLEARNDFAGAVSAYRVAILEFRRDTGTLRVTDEGQWGDDVLIEPVGP